MKVLLLNYEYPPLGGGAGMISQHIAEGLARLGHGVTVVTTLFTGESAVTEGNPTIHRLPSKRRFAYRSNIVEMLSWMRHSKAFLKDHLKENTYDVCLANFALPGGDVAKWAQARFGIPYAVLSHGHDIPWFFPRQMFVYHFAAWPWIKLICRRASLIFVQSGDMFSNARRFVGRNCAHKIRLIANGADFRSYFPDPTYRSKEFLILFAGRLVKQKGPMLFLDTMKLLAEWNLPFTVHVIGDGNMRKKMEAFVTKHRLTERIVFKGWLSKEEMSRAYQTAHVMIAPSLNEGMSMAMNEALASGLYVFTTPVSCNETIIEAGVNGEIVATGKIADLAERIRDYYEQKFKKGYTVLPSAVTRFVSAYDWDTIVKRYEEDLQAITFVKNENDDTHQN
jgi:glycosyltransferase involved in cell wall biosynthesis